MLTFIVALAAVVVLLPAAGFARAMTIDGARLAAVAAASFFVARAFRAARRRADIRGAWILFAAGTLAWLGAEGVTFYYGARVVGGAAPAYPAFADVLWGAGYVFIAAAAIWKIAKPPSGVSAQAVAGALATAAVGLILSVNFVIIPALRNPATTAGEKFAGVFFGGADFVLAAAALVLIAVHGRRGLGRPWAQVALGLILCAAGDTIYWHLAAAGLYGPAGSLVTALFWVAGFLLIGFGAYYRRLLLKGVVTLDERGAAC